MKILKYVLGCVFLIIGLSIIAVTVPMQVERDYNKTSYDFEQDMSDINGIDIFDESIDIEIVETDDDIATFYYYGDANSSPEYYQSENKFYIRNEQKYSWLQFFDFTFNYNSKLVIKLPNNYNGSLIINTSNGSVDIEGNTDYVFTDIDIKTHNSKINIDNVNVTNAISADTSNARIELSNLDLIDVKLKTSNGSIDLYNVSSDSFKATTSNGPITFDNLSVTSSIDLTTKNGKITGSINDNKNNFNIVSETSNGNNNVETNNNIDATKQMKLKTTNGNINITFKE